MSTALVLAGGGVTGIAWEIGVLLGLKENIIIGKLIPAGSGMSAYRSVQVSMPDAIDDLFRVYDIRMVGRETLDGRDTIVSTLTPNGTRPRTDDGDIMRHFKARAWVSESDYELVRVELEALDDLPVALAVGRHRETELQTLGNAVLAAAVPLQRPAHPPRVGPPAARWSAHRR